MGGCSSRTKKTGYPISGKASEMSNRGDSPARQNISQAAIEEYVRHALEADPVRADWRELATWTELDPSSLLVPTLLIQGARDPLALSENQAAFFWRLGTADRTWITLPGGDHAAHLETPRPAFIHAMVSFLRQPR